jgi:hypothetical protein
MTWAFSRLGGIKVPMRFRDVRQRADGAWARIHACFAGWLGIIGSVTKDRTRRRELARDVQIVVERSSTHPVEYAIVLLVERDGAWHTVRTFDNAHAPTEHHEHRYVGSDKQPTNRLAWAAESGDARSRDQAIDELERYRS